MLFLQLLQSYAIGVYVFLGHVHEQPYCRKFYGYVFMDLIYMFTDPEKVTCLYDLIIQQQFNNCEEFLFVSHRHMAGELEMEEKQRKLSHSRSKNIKNDMQIHVLYNILFEFFCRT